MTSCSLILTSVFTTLCCNVVAIWRYQLPSYLTSDSRSKPINFYNILVSDRHDLALSIISYLLSDRRSDANTILNLFGIEDCWGDWIPYSWSGKPKNHENQMLVCGRGLKVMRTGWVERPRGFVMLQEVRQIWRATSVQRCVRMSIDLQWWPLIIWYWNKTVYEVVILWCSKTALWTALQVPPLVRHPDTSELLVNLDPLIYQVIEESVNMTKMQLSVPRDAQLLLYSKQKLHRHHSLLLQVLKDNADIRAKIEDFSQPLFNTSLKKVRRRQPLQTFFLWFR